MEMNESMDNIKISIIILTFQKFDNLENNLRSIKAQSFKDYEVIIQDDGSDNFDADYITSMCQGISAFKIFHSKTNNGTVKNYNLAINRAVGEYIVPLSQDDVFYNDNTLADIYEILNTEQYDVLLGKSIGRKTGNIKPSEYDFALIKNGNTKNLWLRCAYANCISGATLYFRKEFLLARGSFDEEARLIEDHSIVMDMLNNNIRIPVMEKATVLYGEDGVTGSYYHPSTTIIKDNVLIYSKYIIPHLDSLYSRFNRKVITWRMIRWKSYIEKQKMRIGFLDVYAWLFLTSLVCKVFRKIDCNALRNKLMIKYEARHAK